ncbi:MAG: MoaD family protein [Nitrospinaceae bacterium]|nr:MoaD/ThiS family protein [Nitrospinaceae bacterium]NIR53273.1 MoaD/ThiS family protein [Nitrospinaceae bacterium]NIS83671.1 MoaD/ThiS family protein [Nitrospinaceae bacterium]NIT80460.1 MoaD/ThiS family protein [Nitrospinaceae bacterium]NIU42798.1 MoaD/ThiS family protein [Nitrospinaceae bacterium]
MVTVKYFANLKQMAGKDQDEFEIAEGTTLEQLSERIGQAVPQLGDMVREKKVMISINYDVVPLDTVVQDGDEIALLPPFSGGAV